MTTLEKALKDRKISYYQLAKLMGKNPNHYNFHYRAKAQGLRRIESEELLEICEKITEYSDKPIKPSDLQFNILSVSIR